MGQDAIELFCSNHDKDSFSIAFIFAEIMFSAILTQGDICLCLNVTDIKEPSEFASSVKISCWTVGDYRLYVPYSCKNVILLACPGACDHELRLFAFLYLVSLSCIGAGNQSLAAKDKWLLDSKSLQITSKEHSMKSILDTIFSRFVNSTANFDKQVWLSLTHVMLLIY